jgi:beta-galactosidase/beta-glucuronidase
MGKISTIYGENVDKEHPLSSHPNPYFERDCFISLNGPWDFALNNESKIPDAYTDIIIVPFSVETPLSGIEKPVSSSQYMHYRKIVSVPDDFVGKSGLLHFDAIDQTADVYIDGDKVASHEGGYFPFFVFIPLLKKSFVVAVVAHDDTKSSIFPRGKQSLQPGGIWYHPTSGIWQSVYLEKVPTDGFISSLKVSPDFDAEKVKIHAEFVGLKSYPSVSVYFSGQLVAKNSFDQDGNVTLDLKYNFFPWSADNPNLYTLVVSDGYDVVHSIFGFRKISITAKGDHHFLMVNNEPVFLSALLDQGYWPESGLTPPSDEAIANDITIAKKAGFNCLRKHIKIEPMKWYYLCDKLGMYVSQDFVNGGSNYSRLLIRTRPLISFPLSDRNNALLGRATEGSKIYFIADMKETVSHLEGVSSILIWTIFNEGWGQFDAAKLSKKLKELDPTRLIDSTSGWFDQGAGDFSSFHFYFRSPRILNDGLRILSLSEFGGFSLPIPDHDYSSKIAGYKTYYTFESYNAAVNKLYQDSIERLISKQDLSVSVYTQLTDVEENVDGIITYDRKILKIDGSAMKAENTKLYGLYEDAFKKAN